MKTKQCRFLLSLLAVLLLFCLLLPRAAFAECDELRRDSDLERANNGVTIIVI